eukprot:TRINITY_DN4678_c0_g1_i3.p1 TRINITY_DN4678_c0_g1~~TRINITY_DN4678_c0_g1_i3.p1  ORF type:complete len:277 (+),score=52.76 TRINITY_DN4678_c0_g1_i3:132-962(+)
MACQHHGHRSLQRVLALGILLGCHCLAWRTACFSTYCFSLPRKFASLAATRSTKDSAPPPSKLRAIDPYQASQNLGGDSISREEEASRRISHEMRMRSIPKIPLVNDDLLNAWEYDAEVLDFMDAFAQKDNPIPGTLRYRDVFRLLEVVGVSKDLFTDTLGNFASDEELEINKLQGLDMSESWMYHVDPVPDDKDDDDDDYDLKDDDFLKIEAEDDGMRHSGVMSQPPESVLDHPWLREPKSRGKDKKEHKPSSKKRALNNPGRGLRGRPSELRKK